MVESAESTEEINNGERLYGILSDRYKLAKERNDALILRAQGLLGFISIVNTFLVGFILAIASKEELRNFLKSSCCYSLFKWAVILSFIFYLISILFTVSTIMINKYMPVPQIRSKRFVKDVFENNVNLSLYGISMQFYDATDFYNVQNKRKYTYLKIAISSLTVAIIFTTLLGIITAIMISMAEISV